MTRSLCIYPRGISILRKRIPSCAIQHNKNAKVEISLILSDVETLNFLQPCIICYTLQCNWLVLFSLSLARLLCSFRIMLIWTIYAFNAVPLIFCQGICILPFFSSLRLNCVRTHSKMNATSKLKMIHSHMCTRSFKRDHTFCIIGICRLLFVIWLASRSAIILNQMRNNPWNFFDFWKWFATLLNFRQQIYLYQ